LPEGYARAVVRGALVVALRDQLEFAAFAVARAGTLLAFAASRAGAQPLRGRGIAYRIDGPAPDDWVVRHYRRGGAVAPFLCDRYVLAGPSRPFRELRASEEVRARGVPTPRVLALAVYRAPPFYRADIATEHVAGAVDLAALSFGERRAGDADRVAAWAAAGALVRRAGRAGVLHVDLNLANILIHPGPAGPTAWLIDLDRCRVLGTGSRAAIDRMAARIHRSREKLERGHRTRIGRAELDAFRAAIDG
jgi:3-deoxy-D-manno-octulosonic acid kinase